MLKFINLKKLTTNALIGISVAGSLIAFTESNRFAIATSESSTSCEDGNQGHGNNLDAPVTLPDGRKVTVSKYDPTNPGRGGKDNSLKTLLMSGGASSGQISVVYEGGAFNLSDSDAQYVLDNVPDLEPGCDYDNDGITNENDDDIFRPNVGLELLLSIDVSTSVDHAEFELQRDGYVAAFQDPLLQQAIKDLGSEGMVVNMQFWATNAVVDIGWHRLVVDDNDNITGLTEFIAAINRVKRHGKKDEIGQDLDDNNLRKRITTDGTAITSSNGTYMGGGTDIKLGIDEAKNLILNNNYHGRRLVIDISGDGIPKNTPYSEATATADYGYRAGQCGFTLDCPPVASARDAAVAAGITINGLPIVGTETFSNNRDENGNRLSMFEHKLDEHYRDYVIGGDNAFLVRATFDNFAEAAKRKIIGEITNVSVNNAPVAQPDEASVLMSEASITIDALLNDSDIDGNTFTITSVDNVTGGTASIVDNKVVFSPGDTPGTYTFQYTITDDDPSEPLTATADITVEVFAYAD